MTSNIPAVVENHLDAVQCFPDGKIILGSSNLTGRYWNGSLWCFQDVNDAPDVEKCFAGIEVSSGICDLAVYSQNKSAVGLDSGSLEVYQLDTKLQTFTWIFGACEHDDSITSLAINCDNSNLVTAGADKCVKIWDLETWCSSETFRPVHDGTIWQVVCSSEDPQVLITCGQDGKILLFDRRLPKPATILDSNPLKSEITSVAWNPTSTNLIAAGDESGFVAIKDIRQKSNVCSWEAHKRRIFRMSFSASHPWLATCADDTDVCVTNMEKNEPVLLYKDERHEDFIRGLAWQSKTELITCGWDKKVLNHVITKM